VAISTPTGYQEGRAYPKLALEKQRRYLSVADIATNYDTIEHSKIFDIWNTYSGIKFLVWCISGKQVFA